MLVPIGNHRTEIIAGAVKKQLYLRHFLDSGRYQQTPIEVFHFRAYITDTEPIPARGSLQDGQCTPKRKYGKSEIADMLPKALSVFYFSYTICNDTPFSIPFYETTALCRSKFSFYATESLKDMTSGMIL